MIAIIDYGAGNLRSVANAVSSLGYHPVITGDPATVLRAEAVILPGVGAAGDTMKNLVKAGLAEAVRQLIDADRYLFAVCVGMQVLFDYAEEGGGHHCLGVFPGTVRRLPPGLKVPHMGWNQVKQSSKCALFEGIPDRANFYFVHSYYPDPADASVVAGTTEYGVSFCSVAVRHNLVATQFHPEKSGENGLRMYQNFLKLATASGKQRLHQGAAP
jgi:glutamine amidotransferase